MVNGLLVLDENGGGTFLSIENGSVDVSSHDWTDRALSTDNIEWVEPMCFAATLSGQDLDVVSFQKVNVVEVVTKFRKEGNEKEKKFAALLVEFYAEHIPGECSKCGASLPNSHSDLCVPHFNEWFHASDEKPLPVNDEPSSLDEQEFYEAWLDADAEQYAAARLSENE